jgi:hypothetical protein
LQRFAEDFSLANRIITPGSHLSLLLFGKSGKLTIDQFLQLAYFLTLLSDLHSHHPVFLLQADYLEAPLDLFLSEVLNHLVFLESHVFELLVDAVDVIQVGLYAVDGGFDFLIAQNVLDLSQLSKVLAQGRYVAVFLLVI